MVEILPSLVDWVRGSLVLAVLFTILVALAQPLYRKVRERFEWKWLWAAFATAFVSCLILVSVVYFLPVSLTPKPIPFTEELAPDLVELAVFGLVQVARTLFVSLVLAVLVMPFALLAALVNDYLAQRSGGSTRRGKPLRPNRWGNTFLSVFVVSALFELVALFLVPWLLSGLVYFIFFF